MDICVIALCCVNNYFHLIIRINNRVNVPSYETSVFKSIYSSVRYGKKECTVLKDGFISNWNIPENSFATMEYTVELPYTYCGDTLDIKLKTSGFGQKDTLCFRFVNTDEAQWEVEMTDSYNWWQRTKEETDRLLHRKHEPSKETPQKTPEITQNPQISPQLTQEIVARETDMIEKNEEIAPTTNIKEDLDKLIGLAGVKESVETLFNFIKAQQMRKAKGLKVPQVSYHCVFTGNPGTGKTSVARILAKIYQELGVLEQGHLVETDRSGLVAEYVGQTAVKTNNIIDSALDGVLFIDEAYSLATGGENDFGKEAISTLLKRMEDDRDRLIVILAGYSDEMKQFIDANPGLESRFRRYIDFPDYSAEELFAIFNKFMHEYEYVLADDAESAVQSKIRNSLDSKDNHFGNGRYIRNLFESIIEKQVNRISSIIDPTEKDLSEITSEDII